MTADKSDLGATPVSAPWHLLSYERLLHQTLPELLGARLPLAGYEVEETEESAGKESRSAAREAGDASGTYTCRIRITLQTGGRDLPVRFDSIPRPDADGLFRHGGQHRLVLPIARGDDLESAEILCVGEQLFEHIRSLLGEAPRDLLWNEGLVHSWLPLKRWIEEFLDAVSQPFDTTNALAKRSHLRRLRTPDRGDPVGPGDPGRTCLLETPEGPNLGRILSIATGAVIRESRLLVLDRRPEAGLGLAATMAPFLEHNDPTRQLMGCNRMRQWEPFPAAEPALVQTGHEFDAPDFWCGLNLLTAFLSWRGDTYEDGIVLSESAAARFRYEHPLEPGDKFSNRHGQIGVISRILPDEEMPHLQDGTAVELVVSFLGCHARMNYGQIREAILGRIAQAEGRTALAPPFHAPDEQALRSRLRKAGLSESGMERLTDGRNGPLLERPSTVGPVYWGLTIHQARYKMMATTSVPVSGPAPTFVGQRCGALEVAALFEAGAFENIREAGGVRSMAHPEAETLAERVASGTVEPAGPPRPGWHELARKLEALGIRGELRDGGLSFHCETPPSVGLELARPVLHPWLHVETTTIGRLEDQPGWPELQAIQDRVRRMSEGKAPEILARKAREELTQAVTDLIEGAIGVADVRFSDRCLFSGRAVAAPAGEDLRTDQVGLPEEMAWELFTPLVRRTGLDREAIRERSAEATKSLDEAMARSWILVYRAPTLSSSSLMAFHAVRQRGRVIRLHPLVTHAFNADFDGDQIAVSLPVTAEAQREAGEKLSVAGHLRRDPGLLTQLCPAGEMLWGLAELSRLPRGHEEIERILGASMETPDGHVTRTTLESALSIALRREGTEGVLARLEQLARRGFEVAHRSGASLSPFFGAPIDRSTRPADGDAKAWAAYAEEITEQLAAWIDFDLPEVGPQILAVKSGARGSLEQLRFHLGPRVDGRDARGDLVLVKSGNVDGLQPEELFACAAAARRSLQRLGASFRELAEERLRATLPTSFHVLARAMRAEHPGRVFARAALNREVDPLSDVGSRLFVGLAP